CARWSTFHEVILAAMSVRPSPLKSPLTWNGTGSDSSSSAHCFVLSAAVGNRQPSGGHLSLAHEGLAALKTSRQVIARICMKPHDYYPDPHSTTRVAFPAVYPLSTLTGDTVTRP